jgi:hypothetical protein
MRERIFDVIEPCTDDNKVSKIYDIVMIIEASSACVGEKWALPW